MCCDSDFCQKCAVILVALYLMWTQNITFPTYFNSLWICEMLVYCCRVLSVHLSVHSRLRWLQIQPYFCSLWEKDHWFKQQEQFKQTVALNNSNFKSSYLWKSHKTGLTSVTDHRIQILPGLRLNFWGQPMCGPFPPWGFYGHLPHRHGVWMKLETLKYKCPVAQSLTINSFPKWLLIKPSQIWPVVYRICSVILC